MKPDTHKTDTGIHVLAVQCLVVVMLVAALWLMVTFGGTAAKSLGRFMKKMLKDNSIAAAVSGLSEQNPSLDAEEDEPQVVMTGARYVSPPSAEITDSAAHLPIDPSSGHITSLYGKRDNPTAAGEEFHKGIDIGANAGTPIASPGFGMVVDTGTDKWYGNYLIIACGTTEYKFGHCQELYVKRGDTVQRGETVAAVGHSGNATGSHLHVEIRQDGELIDPAQIFSLNDYD